MAENVTLDVDINIKNLDRLDQARTTLTELKNEASQIPSIGDTMVQGLESAL